MGTLVAFPLIRQGRDGMPFVDNIAHQMMKRDGEVAEKHLAYTLRRKAEAMERRGFPREIIDAEIKSAETAIRAALWKAVMEGGAA